MAEANPQLPLAQLPECRSRSGDSQGTLPPYEAEPSLEAADLAKQHSSPPNMFTSTPSAWPPEIVDSMAWSVQFFGAAQSKEQM